MAMRSSAMTLKRTGRHGSTLPLQTGCLHQHQMLGLAMAVGTMLPDHRAQIPLARHKHYVHVPCMRVINALHACDVCAGRNVMAAPVLTHSTQHVTPYFPPATTWFHLVTGAVYAGAWAKFTYVLHYVLHETV